MTPPSPSPMPDRPAAGSEADTQAGDADLVVGVLKCLMAFKAHNTTTFFLAPDGDQALRQSQDLLATDLRVRKQAPQLRRGVRAVGAVDRVLAVVSDDELVRDEGEAPGGLPPYVIQVLRRPNDHSPVLLVAVRGLAGLETVSS